MAWLNQTDNMCNNKENDHSIEFISKPNRLSGNGPRPDGKQIQLDSVRFVKLDTTRRPFCGRTDSPDYVLELVLLEAIFSMSNRLFPLLMRLSFMSWPCELEVYRF